MIVPGGKMIKNLFTDKIAEVYQSAFTRRGAQVRVALDMTFRAFNASSGLLTSGIPVQAIVCSLSCLCHIILIYASPATLSIFSDICFAFPRTDCGRQGQESDTQRRRHRQRS